MQGGGHEDQPSQCASEVRCSILKTNTRYIQSLAGDNDKIDDVERPGQPYLGLAIPNKQTNTTQS